MLESAVQMDSAEALAIAGHNFIVDDRLLRQNTTLTVRLDNSGKLLKVNCDDFAKIARPQTVRIAAAPAYKAKLGYLAPRAEQKLLPQFESCFLGVSLENSNFIRPKLLSMLEWISNRFKNCTVLVGDSIHRITLTANGVPAEMALQQAMKLGDDFIEREANCFAAFSERCNFTVARCSEVQQQGRCNELHAELNQLFQTSATFRDSVLEFAQSYHQKLRETLSEEQWQIRMTRSKDYFLEEFAIIACLQEQGWPVLVYPGSFSTLVDIVDGRIDNAPPALKALKLACLHIKKR